MGVTVGPQICILYDANGVAMAVENGVATPANTRGVLVAGSDGSNTRFMRTAADGTVRTDPTGTTTQPVSAASLPLPTGAAQEHATAGSPNSTRLSDGANFYDATKTGQLPTALTGSGNLKAALLEALPAGSALVGKFQLRNPGNTADLGDASNPVRTDPTGGTVQPVSGTVTANQGTANSAANRWPIYLTNGTQNMPTMDAAARAGFFQRTDGTNIAPTMDAVGRAGYQRITDGTNQMPTMDVAARAGFVKAFGPDANGAAPTQAPVLMAGWDGTVLRIVKTDDQGRVRIVPATGTISGFADGQIVLASSTVTAVRSTTYTEPSSNAQRSVASSSANDTSAGTGARTIRLTYYSFSAGVITGPFTEDITLNGTSNVNTVSSTICFIEKIEVLTVGSTGSNVGTITLFGATAGGGGTVWTIAATANKTFGCHHYVVNSRTCKITGLLVGIKGADTTGGFLRSKDPTNANSAEVQITDVLRAPSSGQNFRSYGTAIQIPGPARITGYAAPDSTSSRTYYTSFDFFEE